MLRIIDWYIGKTVLGASLLCLLTLNGLSAIIKYVDQLRVVGQGDYTLAEAGIYVLLSIPREMELFFPMAALLGALIGLGSLASSSELVVMQAAGISRLQIVLAVLKTAVPLMLAVMLIGEYVAPVSDQLAMERKTVKMSSGEIIQSQQGVWAKDGQSFVKIGEVRSDTELAQVVIYRMDSANEVKEAIYAEQAEYDGERWILHQVRHIQFQSDQVVRSELPSEPWFSHLTPDKLGVVSTDPEDLSISGLDDYVDYLHANRQDSARYELALYRKLMQPLTIMVMMLLALSFVFGPLRSVTMGARILMGIIAGFVFYITNEIFGPISLVYQIPSLIGAMGPSALFLGGALVLLRRHG